MSSPPRKRNTTKGDASPDSSTGTDPLLVEHPHDQPPEQVSTTTTTTRAMTATPAKDTRSSLDRFLQGYTSFMSSALYQDRGIKLLQYTLWAFSRILKDRAAARDACKKLFNELSFARYVLRLLGLPPAMEAVRSGSWSATSARHPTLHKFLGQVLAWSMIGYYPLEHGAYLQWQAPKLLFPKTGGPSRLAEKLSAWSCRFWTVYIVAEIWQCWLTLREETQQQLQIGQAKKQDDNHSDDDDDDDDDNNNNNNNNNTKQTVSTPPANMAKLRHLRLQILRDVLFTLPAIHWSLPNWDRDPWLPDSVVNTCMWLESVVCMYQSIVSFQQQK